jgi:Uma2 family endonuclease
MIANPDNLYISPKNYLEGERISSIKHEYRQGQVWAMAGGTQAHGTVVLNIATLVRTHLRGSQCRAFVENMKVRIETTDGYYYPDVVVTCDDRDRHLDQDFISYPSLIVEVLSPKTEAFDRGAKFADYRTIDTLREYVLVSCDRRQIECYRRNDCDRWELQCYETEAAIAFESVNLSADMTAIYEDVEFASKVN